MKCPRCRSRDVRVELVRERRATRHSLAWWLLIGWWIWPFKLLFLPVIWSQEAERKGKRPPPRRDEMVTRSVAVCQHCGHHWRSGEKGSALCFESNSKKRRASPF